LLFVVGIFWRFSDEQRLGGRGRQLLAVREASALGVLGQLNAFDVAGDLKCAEALV
jgi:hypothetical protein